MFFDRFRIFATSLCILPACAGVNLTDAMRQRIYENSPRMRGGQPDLVIDAYATFGFSPACAGVNPTKTVFLIPLQRHSPRMRGGQPGFGRLRRSGCLFTPHARGSTLCRTFIGVPSKIHPACAGGNPSASNQGHCGRNSPRTRGGQPARIALMTLEAQFSPHARGSTLPDCKSPQQNALHPACAGVNPRSWRRLTARKNSPRMRGGQPFAEERMKQRKVFSPHARGSTHIFSHFSFRMPILPTCAGVNPMF